MPIRIFNTFDDPLASTGSTLAFGVNDTDQIVGYYQNGSGNHGFLLSGGIYTTLDDPSATLGTIAQGINSLGQIVGFYDNASGNHGFLLSGGTYTTLNDPSATHGTVAFGVNAAGQIVGYYTDNNGDHGFLYDPNSGVFPPTSPSMIPWPTTSPLHEASTASARSSGTISITPISPTASS